jgi:peroxiredoxin Q/BCP
MAAEVGEAAPDFTLEGSDNTDAGRRRYTLSEHRGQVVVLVVYPGDNTPLCTRQLNTYSEDLPSFTEAGATVLAISPP